MPARPVLRSTLAGLLLLIALLTASAGPASAAPDGVPGLWTLVADGPPADRAGRQVEIRARELRTFRLDAQGMQRALSTAPLELTAAARRDPAEVALPAPDGGFQRFAIQESPVMEAALAAAHPDIRTFRGVGIDDETATVRLDFTPLGFHASVRGADGTWYIDPYYHLDQSVYASYFAEDLRNVHGTFVERGLGELARAESILDDEDVAPVAERSAGDVLRTYRLALVSDQDYAIYFGGDTNPANVTAAKVTLMNRVTQIYEDETAIRMVLIANNDLLNLNTDALAIEPNGPCGAAACFTQSQLNSCGGGTLNRNRIVIGQIIGASNYDIGHIVLGAGGGGVAGLGVVGRDGKARGCTGQLNPVGDFFAVDYVAHEMGHQFSGNHTFNGNQVNCSGGNRNGANSVEPGSGSSIMAYAGICGQDNIQPHSDPYWSQRSFDEITAYVTSTQSPINEVQNVALRGFDTDGDSFTLTWNGSESSPLVRGTTYNLAGIEAALAEIGVQGLVQGYGGGTAPDDTGFQVTFTGAQAGTNHPSLEVTDKNQMDGFVGEIAKGGPVDNQGWEITSTNNVPPTVSAPASYTIPYRTPFELTGSATDANGETLTYMWEQNNQGVTAKALADPAKTDGPLFRQFGTTLLKPPYDPLLYNSPGENHPTTDPTRVFPDMAQILANNTNAETGDCPGPPKPPPPSSGREQNLPQPQVDCYSEFLPTPGYAGPMSFRLTARDGNPVAGGVNSADTTVNLAPGTGPFLVTSQNAPVEYPSGSVQSVTWDPAGTSAAPVNAASVRILLSTDGGVTFPFTLTSSTPNDGSEDVALPVVSTDAARIKVQPVDNVFFDVSNASFSISGAADVSVRQQVSASSARVGERLSYTVTVTNAGPAVIMGARVVSTLPRSAILLSRPETASCGRAGDRLRCDVGEIAVGGSAILRYVVVPVAPGSAETTATLTRSDPDTAPQNDRDGARVDVRRPRCTIVGTPDDDILRGSAGTDVICGRGGSDRIRGRAGDDVLVGAGARDRLAGGPGADVVAGSAGRDRIAIKDRTAGNDAALGGGGKDRCRRDADDVVLGCP